MRIKITIGEIGLREVVDDDLKIFFDHQSDPIANKMAAFTSKDPSDKKAYANARSKEIEEVLLKLK